MPAADRGSVARGIFENGRGDAVTARLLASQEVPDRAVGFHAQQAVELFLKAVLAHEGVAYERTHDLQRLVGLLARSAVNPPPGPEDLAELTPWAVELRYGDPFDPEPIDRAWALGVVERVQQWAERRLAPG